MPCVGPTDGRGAGEVPPPSSVGTLSGGAVTSELVVPVSTGTPVELVPPGRATTSVGVGVSKALLHQHPHTVGTVVAAGESPAAGEYKGRVGVLCAVALSCAQGSVPCVGPTDGRGVGEVPPPLSVGTLSGGAVTSELVVPVSTGTPVELVPPGRATTSVGAGVSKELLHQHPHTAGTVVAAGESPAKGEYGGVGGGVPPRLSSGRGLLLVLGVGGSLRTVSLRVRQGSLGGSLRTVSLRGRRGSLGGSLRTVSLRVRLESLGGSPWTRKNNNKM